jgi:hypothetical protein
MRVRIIATKTAIRDLKPGDLFSDMGGSHWNLEMSGRVSPQAYIRTNDATDDDISKDSMYVYRLTIVKEHIDDKGVKVQQRDVHRLVVLDPNAPPGSKPKEP